MGYSFNPFTGNFDSDGTGSYIPLVQKGAANGVATLDGAGKIPVGQLPNAVFIYQGTWNPNTNTPALVDGTGVTGSAYWVSAARLTAVPGLSNSSMVNFQIGDIVLYNGTQYQLTTPAAGVQSVNGLQGVVILNTDNISEGSTNLYFTNARAQTAVVINSLAGSQTTQAPSVSAVNTALNGKANTSLSNLISTAVNQSLIPGSGVLTLGNSGNFWQNGYITNIKDASNVNTIVTTSRTLNNTSGTTVLDWSGTDVSLSNVKLTDVADPSSAQDAVTLSYVNSNFASNLLDNLSSPTAINQDLLPGLDNVKNIGASANGFAGVYSYALLDPASSASVDMVGKTLIDSTGAISLDFENRILYGPDGSSTILRWDEGVAGIDVVGNYIINVNNPVNAQDAANKTYVDSAAGSWNKQTFTLSATNITNGYVDLTFVAKTNSIDFVFNGLISRESVDYTVSYTGGAGSKTRVTFSGHTPALVAGNIIIIKYSH